MPSAPEFAAPTGSAVVGCCDRRVVVQQVSLRVGNESRWQVDSPALGRALTDLVAATGAVSVRTTLDRCAHSGRAALLGVRFVRGTALGPEGAASELIVVPQRPAPSCTFALLPTADPTDTPVVYDVEVLVRQWGAALLAPAVVEPAQVVSVPGWRELSPREMEVVTRLVRGDRAPAIARAMVLSQSTVRSHLSSAGAKLGVHDQQGILDLFRPASS